jgi:hypothetical protein
MKKSGNSKQTIMMPMPIDKSSGKGTNPRAEDTGRGGTNYLGHSLNGGVTAQQGMDKGGKNNKFD